MINLNPLNDHDNVLAHLITLKQVLCRESEKTLMPPILNYAFKDDYDT